MNILVRVDSSNVIGSGHAMRCLTLSRSLRDKGCKVTIASRDHPGNYNYIFLQDGFELYELPITGVLNDNEPSAKDYASLLGVTQEIDAEQVSQAVNQRFFDWIVVDHYALDVLWQTLMRPLAGKIMVIDDLANRIHDCDLLLDQNFYANKEQRYKDLVPEQCLQLLGLSYLLLSKEYEQYSSYNKVRSGDVSKILVFFGSIDDAKQTELVLDAIAEGEFSHIQFDIIVGLKNPRRNFIESRCKKMLNVNFYCQVTNMSKFIMNADLALGAGGATGWERCQLGLPTISVVVADNQMEAVLNADNSGAILNLGHFSELTARSYQTAIEELLSSPQRIREMSEKSLAIFGKEDDKKVIDHMLCS